MKRRATDIAALIEAAGDIAGQWSEGSVAAARCMAEYLANVWDEAHNHCFHVEDPNNPNKGNPYRKVFE
jgi:hypothetical protein